MKITFEGGMREFAKCFGQEHPQHVLTQKFEVTLGNEVFQCTPVSVDIGRRGWDVLEHAHGPYVELRVEAYSKRLQEITEAKALVNKTKEAHKEARRKLAELQEGK